MRFFQSVVFRYRNALCGHSISFCRAAAAAFAAAAAAAAAGLTLRRDKRRGGASLPGNVLQSSVPEGTPKAFLAS